MAVVVNEFEVVEQSPARGERSAGGAADEPKQEEQPAPEEIAHAVAQQIERYERVRAH
jgi:hypothetical protein